MCKRVVSGLQPALPTHLGSPVFVLASIPLLAGQGRVRVQPYERPGGVVGSEVCTWVVPGRLSHGRRPPAKLGSSQASEYRLHARLAFSGGLIRASPHGEITYVFLTRKPGFSLLAMLSPTEIVKIRPGNGSPR